MNPLRILSEQINLSISLAGMKQEILTNRRTQVGIVILAGLLAILLWPNSGQPQRTPVGTDSVSMAALRSLPDLSALDQSSEIPPLPKLLRDPFLFEGPRPPEIIKKAKPMPPPPEPTAEEIAQKQLEQDRQLEMATAPNEYRFIGFLRTSKAGVTGAFMNGEEPTNLKIGSIIRGRWKLIEIKEDNARFQNLKYPDLFFAASASSIEN